MMLECKDCSFFYEGYDEDFDIVHSFCHFRGSFGTAPCDEEISEDYEQVWDEDCTDYYIEVSEDESISCV